MRRLEIISPNKATIVYQCTAADIEAGALRIEQARITQMWSPIGVPVNFEPVHKPIAVVFFWPEPRTFVKLYDA